MPNDFCQRKQLDHKLVEIAFVGGVRQSHSSTDDLYSHIVGKRTWTKKTNCIVYHLHSAQVLEMFLGSRDHSNRGSREGSMGPPSRQSSNASVSSITSSQDAGSTGSQFFEVTFSSKLIAFSFLNFLKIFVGFVFGEDKISLSSQSTTNIHRWRIGEISCP